MADDRDARLKAARDKIDAVDVRILELVNERTQIVEEIGRIKQEFQMAIYEPKREEQVFENITRNNKGPLPDDAVKRVFERIIDEMRTVQRTKMLQKKQQEESK
jgi:chorismate mutase-like protein